MDDDRLPESRRELDTLRQHYQEHRRTVRHLLKTAPDEKLASAYESTLAELQRSIDQLDRLDRATTPGKPLFDPNETRAVRTEEKPLPAEAMAVKPASGFEETELSTKSRSWDDPFVRDATATGQSEKGKERSSPAGPWIAGIVILIAIVLGIVFFWPKGESPAEDTAQLPESEIVEEPAEPAPPPPAELSIEPAEHDYGVIYKGTRSVHRFTVRNRTDQPMTLSVSRSECRCLWYDYPAEVPAGGSIDLAITVDGARAETGPLAESVVVSSEGDAAARAEIALTAEIRER